MIKKCLLVLIVVVSAWFWVNQSHTPTSDDASDSSSTSNTAISGNASDSEKLLAFAFASQQSDIQIQGKGKVTAILKDDNKGSRHQRFILTLKNQQTLLVAHNIDLAPRINNLKKGDTLEFFGEYEWNKKGGVIHWTHKDPKNKHISGWLKHRGQLYQ